MLSANLSTVGRTLSHYPRCQYFCSASRSHPDKGLFGLAIVRPSCVPFGFYLVIPSAHMFPPPLAFVLPGNVILPSALITPYSLTKLLIRVHSSPHRDFSTCYTGNIVSPLMRTAPPSLSVLCSLSIACPMLALARPSL